MAKTLLDITQEILSAMTGDEVNSIHDTAEAESVATIVVSVFESLVSNRNWSSHKQMFTLDSSTDSELPTHATLPENCKELLSLSYNKRKLDDPRFYYKEITWKAPDDFLRYTNARDSSKDYIKTVIDPTGVRLFIRNDTQPTYYTSFDDETIIFDSWFSSLDSTIQSNYTQAWGYIMPEATYADDWVPDLPKEAFKLLIEEAKSTARFQLDSTTDIKAEAEAGKQNRWLARKNWSVNGDLNYPNYGRRSVHVRDRTFKDDR